MCLRGFFPTFGVDDLTSSLNSPKFDANIVPGLEDGPVGGLARLRDMLTNSLSIPPPSGTPGNPAK